MKKLTALFLGVTIALSQLPAFAQTPLESVILQVKERIEIPEEMSELDSQTYTNKEETTYTLNWRNDEGNKNLSVRADANGRILEFSQYDDAWYQKETEFRMQDGVYEQAEKTAEAWLLQIVPELFATEHDKLVPQKSEESLSLRSNVYHFSYQRIRDGLRVDGNNASVSIRYIEDEFHVNNAYISWDYDAVFDTPEATLAESAEVLYQKRFPIEASYRRYDKEKVFLEYITGYEEFLDAKTGEKAERRPFDEDGVYKNAMQEESVTMDAAMSGGGGGLREFEQKEVDAIAGLKTADELCKKLRAMPELGIPETAELTSQNIYKVEDDTYQIRLVLKDGEESRSYATLDAKTGELFNFSNSGYVPYPIVKKTEEERIKADAEGREKSDAFLQKYYADKLSLCKKDEVENGSGVSYIRQIDGYAYNGNSLNASWDTETGHLSYFRMSWDQDISNFPKAELAIGEDAAYQAVFTKYPLELFYLETESGYRTVYAPEKNSVRVDAITGKIIDYSGKEVKDAATGSYSDLSGHWIEEKVGKMARYGIVLSEESEFLPDKTVTQAEYLKVLMKVAYPYYGADDTEEIYRQMIASGILDREEKNPDAEVSKETAVKYLLRTMGVRDVAELEGIYVCDFADADTISPSLYGYCALAKGFGIVNGNGGYLYPQKAINRAEAMSMLYQYLNR